MKKIFLALVESLIRNIGGGVGRKLRYLYYRNRLGACGKNVIIDLGVIIENPENVFVGNNVWIDHYTLIIGGNSTKLKNIDLKINKSYQNNVGEIHFKGENHIAPYVVIQGHGGVEIGQNVTIGSGSKIYSLSHHYRNTLDKFDEKEYYFSSMSNEDKQFFISSPVVIGTGAAIGLNSVLLPGTTIPNGTWLGVNTYIKGYDVKENAVYGTQPAGFIKDK